MLLIFDDDAILLLHKYGTMFKVVLLQILSFFFDQLNETYIGLWVSIYSIYSDVFFFSRWTLMSSVRVSFKFEDGITMSGHALSPLSYEFRMNAGQS